MLAVPYLATNHSGYQSFCLILLARIPVFESNDTVRVRFRWPLSRVAVAQRPDMARRFALALLLAAAPIHAFVTSSISSPALRVRNPASASIHPVRTSSSGSSLRMSGDAQETAASEGKFAKLIADCKDWGLCRFVTINACGAVLETASPMDVGLNFFNVPGKGFYATLARC